MKYKLLDLFCGGGGASLGYEQAGFDVTGVDINPQPHYRGYFVQSSATDYLLKYHHNFDAIHASPPCQKWSKASMQFRIKGKEYPDLIQTIRFYLKKIGKPYVIENVSDSPLNNPVLLCGTMFGIRTYRHRLFESNFFIEHPRHPVHINKNAVMGRRVKEGEFIQYMGHFPDIDIVREMTGLTWLTGKELAQSIPPQYTKYIGKYLMEHLDKNLHF